MDDFDAAAQLRRFGYKNWVEQEGLGFPGPFCVPLREIRPAKRLKSGGFVKIGLSCPIFATFWEDCGLVWWGPNEVCCYGRFI
jgi:hypothetical protein